MPSRRGEYPLSTICWPLLLAPLAGPATEAAATTAERPPSIDDDDDEDGVDGIVETAAEAGKGPSSGEWRARLTMCDDEVEEKDGVPLP